MLDCCIFRKCFFCSSAAKNIRKYKEIRSVGNEKVVGIRVVRRQFYQRTGFAFSAKSLQGFDVAVAVGPTWYYASNSQIQLQINEAEADSVHVPNLASAVSYQAGIGYHFHPCSIKNTTFLSDILLQLNLTHDAATFTGNVNVYDMESGINYRFHAPVSSTRLTLDAKPQLFKIYGIAPYLILGGGIGWDQISFYESTSDPMYSIGAVSLPTSRTTRFTGDLGVGVRHLFTKHFYMTAEYQATYLGDLAPGIQATSQQTVLSAPNFKIWVHSVLISAGWEF